jgi:chitinase
MAYMRTRCFLGFLLCSGGAVAAPTLSPYADISQGAGWSSEYQDVEPMDVSAIGMKSNVKAFHLAFIIDSGSCQPAWGGYPDYSVESKWGKHLTDKMATQGMDITVSFGGFSGSDLSMNCTIEKLTDAYNQIVATYQAKKLDFDIETSAVNVPNLINALVSFQKQNPDVKLSFTLPVLLSGLAPAGKDVVSQAKAANLKFTVNIMTMDYTGTPPGDMADYAKQSANGLHDYLKTVYPDKSNDDLWQMIEITPMIGINDTEGEQFTLQNAATIHDFAVEHKLGVLGMWSINRDKPCADKWVSLTCSGNNLQKNDYDFAHTFMNGMKTK